MNVGFRARVEWGGVVVYSLNKRVKFYEGIVGFSAKKTKQIILTPSYCVCSVCIPFSGQDPFKFCQNCGRIDPILRTS